MRRMRNNNLEFRIALVVCSKKPKLISSLRETTIKAYNRNV